MEPVRLHHSEVRKDAAGTLMSTQMWAPASGAVTRLCVQSPERCSAAEPAPDSITCLWGWLGGGAALVAAFLLTCLLPLLTFPFLKEDQSIPASLVHKTKQFG